MTQFLMPLATQAAPDTPIAYVLNEQVGTYEGLPIIAQSAVDTSNAPVPSLEAASEPAIGTALALPGSKGIWSLQCVLTSGEGVQCNLELSLDGVNFWSEGTWDQTNGFVTNQILAVQGVAAQYGRANLTAITGGSVTATVTAA